MIRARFSVNSNDYRPVLWPIPHPYWCTGFDHRDRPILVAYSDNVEEIRRFWPDAFHIDVMESGLDEYEFTERFPRPEWFTEETIARAAFNAKVDSASLLEKLAEADSFLDDTAPDDIRFSVGEYGALCKVLLLHDALVEFVDLADDAMTELIAYYPDGQRAECVDLFVEKLLYIKAKLEGRTERLDSLSDEMDSRPDGGPA